MKNFFFGLAIFALWLFVIVPLHLAGIWAWFWMPVLFEAPFIVGLAISIVTLVVSGVVAVELELL